MDEGLSPVDDGQGDNCHQSDHQPPELAVQFKSTEHQEAMHHNLSLHPETDPSQVQDTNTSKSPLSSLVERVDGMRAAVQTDELQLKVDQLESELAVAREKLALTLSQLERLQK